MEHVLRDGRPRAVFELLGERFYGVCATLAGRLRASPAVRGTAPRLPPHHCPAVPDPVSRRGRGRGSSRGLACPAVIPTPAAA